MHSFRLWKTRFARWCDHTLQELDVFYSYGKVEHVADRQQACSDCRNLCHLAGVSGWKCVLLITLFSWFRCVICTWNRIWTSTTLCQTVQDWKYGRGTLQQKVLNEKLRKHSQKIRKFTTQWLDKIPRCRTIDAVLLFYQETTNA